MPDPRLTAITDQLKELLIDEPDLIYTALDDTQATISEAADSAPEVTIVGEHRTDEDGLIDAHVINPRTGEVDTLVAVDLSIRHTDLDPEGIDAEESTLHIEYDGRADYEGQFYVTESDNLVVSLPEGWSEI